MKPEIVVTIGLILLIGLFWQGYLLFKFSDHLPPRMYLPLVLGAVVVLGVGGWCVLRLSDEHATFTQATASAIFVRALAIAVLINVKAYFAPFYLAASASTYSYYWFEYGELRHLPGVEEALAWLFEYASQQLSQVYLAATYVYAAAVSIYELFASAES